MVTRRRVLISGAVLGAATTSGGVLLTGGPAAADAYTDLRDRWVDIITGRPDIDESLPEFQTALASLDTDVAGLLAKVDRSNGRTRVFTDRALAQTTNSSWVKDTYRRLHRMALAWATPGSAYHQRTSLLDDILAGLATAHDVVYHDGGPRFDNWYDWDIGSAKPLADVLVLLDTQLPATAREQYAAAIRYHVPDPWYRHDGKELSTFSNRVELCQVALIQGIASRSAARIARAAAGLAPTCEYVQNGDGLWGDGSIIQHDNVAYTGAYGVGWLSVLANLSALLAGSAWDLPDRALQHLYAAVEQAYAPVIHDARLMSFVRGRGISRYWEDEFVVAITAIVAILRLARHDLVDATTRQRWRGRCQGWLERARAKGGRNPYPSPADVAAVGLISELMRSGVTALPEPDGSVIFRNMARAVHRRNGWAFAISMNSNRIARYESINGENLKGFHTGAGMTYLYDDDSTQYTDDFWPTVDPYRLAGTTIDTHPVADGAGQSLSDTRWAGGAVLDGRYCAVGMSLTAATTELNGRKSWFCFDEYVFCMGRPLSGGDGNPVETVVENRNLHATGTNRLIVDGAEWTGTTQTFTDIQWAHLEGVGGYVFATSQQPRIRVDRYRRSGRWRDINIDGSNATVTRNYLSLVWEHGTNPTDGRYAYLVLPKATPERTAYVSAHRDVEIIASTRCHGVRQWTTGITMLNFWGSPHTVGGVSVDNDCSVIVQERDNTLKIAVAEPIRTSATIRVTVTPGQADYRLASKDKTVTVVSTGSSIVLDVQTGEFGKTQHAVFTR